MKLWLDDIRRPTEDGWLWARTNAEALALLRIAKRSGVMVEACSLDHDLGLHDEDPDQPGAYRMRAGVVPPEDGRQLVFDMCEEELVPAEVRLHSWDPLKAEAMALTLDQYGYDCTIAPYVHPAGVPA